MAEGYEPRPANEIIYRNYTITNHAVTSRSSSGAYYSPTNYDISVSGFSPISICITSWSGLSAIVMPYIESGGLGFSSDISQTIGGINVRVAYMKI